MKFRFHTLAELESILDEAHISLPDYALKREAFISGRGEAETRAELDRRIAVTRAALVRGISEPQFSRSGLTRGAAAAFASAGNGLIRDGLFRRTIAYALALNEVNVCGGKIVSFPTAGSCGIVPGLIWAWWDSTHGESAAGDGGGDRALSPENPDHIAPVMIEGPYGSELRSAFLTAGIAGVLIAQRATLSGAEGGCQAECGAAGAMAAAALACLEGMDLAAAFSAASLSLKNSLGLACDPVAGLVEVPCVKRNAFLAVNALTAVELTRAGIGSVIPFDEVVWAMKQIGDSMPSSIKESAGGGLALTPTGLAWKEKLDTM